jgi:hypothetical protein
MKRTVLALLLTVACKADVPYTCRYTREYRPFMQQCALRPCWSREGCFYDCEGFAFALGYKKCAHFVDGGP